MSAAPCIGPARAYNSLQAPEKREYERLAVPVSDGFFVPGIRLDSTLVVANLHAGDGRDARSVRPCADLVFGFSDPPISRLQAGYSPLLLEIDHAC